MRGKACARDGFHPTCFKLFQGPNKPAWHWPGEQVSIRLIACFVALMSFTDELKDSVRQRRWTRAAGAMAQPSTSLSRQPRRSVPEEYCEQYLVTCSRRGHFSGVAVGKALNGLQKKVDGLFRLCQHRHMASWKRENSCSHPLGRHPFLLGRDCPVV